MFEKMLNLIYLMVYFRKKRKHIFLSDFKVAKWHAGLTTADIGVFRMEIPLSVGVVIGVRVVNAEVIGETICENVRLDIEYIKGHKDIRECNFREFKELYSSTILYIRSRGGDLDIVRETKNHYLSAASLKNI